MDSKDWLRKMVDHTIKGDTDAAAKAFKQYIAPKTAEVMGSAAPQEPEPVPEPEAVAEPEPVPEPEAVAEPEPVPEPETTE